MQYQFLGIGYLTWITFLPILGMIVVLLIPRAGTNAMKWTALGATILQLVFAALIWINFNPALTGINDVSKFQFVEKATWINLQGVGWFGHVVIEYFLGIDGLSLPMIVLTSLISFVGVVASWNINKAQKGYFALYLLLDTGMMGVFVALDMFLFYMFWEIMLLPMYFLIGIWGGPRREYAAIKFFLYTLLGSVLILLVMLALYFSVSIKDPVTGQMTHTFNMLAMMNPANYDPNSILGGIGTYWRDVAFIALFIGFAIKVPIFPFHTWLPDAHVEAPTAISVILAGVLLKMGTYGMLRINFPLLPEATQWAAPAIAVFGVINMVYGAFCAMAQEDLKRLVAYSSISHMGFCLLGMAALTPAGIEASIVQMFNHGTITSMLFTLVGVVYDRGHTREISRYGGMATEMPFYTAFFGFAFMASLGLPGLSGFIGEALTFVGAFPIYPALTIIGATSVIFTAGYHLWALQRVFLGKFKQEWRHSHALELWGGKFPEMNFREAMSLAPMAVIVVIIGFWPKPLLNMLDSGVMDLTNLVNPAGASQVASATEIVTHALARLP